MGCTHDMCCACIRELYHTIRVRATHEVETATILEALAAAEAFGGGSYNRLWHRLTCSAWQAQVQVWTLTATTLTADAEALDVVGTGCGLTVTELFESIFFCGARCLGLSLECCNNAASLGNAL